MIANSGKFVVENLKKYLIEKFNSNHIVYYVCMLFGTTNYFLTLFSNIKINSLNFSSKTKYV